MAGLACVRRLVRINSNRVLFLQVRECRKELRTFSANPVKLKEIEGDNSNLSPELNSRWTLLSKRRRHLSPLERISGLLPQDVLSPEVMQLRDQTDTTGDAEPSETHFIQERSGAAEDDTVEEPNPTQAPSYTSFEEESCPSVPGERLLTFGELLIAEFSRKRRVEFKKLFQLQSGARLMSSWGFIQHDSIVGQHSGQFLKTGRGVPILIRRPSLEDYVLLMKRGPSIAYPKVLHVLGEGSATRAELTDLSLHQDAATMLMMMDVTEGDRVLESGSGSGAMSLFLSRAVGSKGCVTSVEVREDHHRRAVLNYSGWRRAWRLRRGEEWPDNVRFLNTDLCAASPLLSGQGFHAAALDLINPHLALPTVTPHLFPGAVCAVYLAKFVQILIVSITPQKYRNSDVTDCPLLVAVKRSITQVIDLLEGLRCLALPLLCERIIEVPLRDWTVAPALQKDGRYCMRKAPVLPGEQLQQREEEAAGVVPTHEGEAEAHEGDGTFASIHAECLDSTWNSSEGTPQGGPPFGSVPYIARPHPEQISHTAFLVKLRKCVS